MNLAPSRDLLRHLAMGLIAALALTAASHARETFDLKITTDSDTDKKRGAEADTPGDGGVQTFTETTFKAELKNRSFDEQKDVVIVMMIVNEDFGKRSQRESALFVQTEDPMRAGPFQLGFNEKVETKMGTIKLETSLSHSVDMTGSEIEVTTYRGGARYKGWVAGVYVEGKLSEVFGSSRTMKKKFAEALPGAVDL